MSIGENIKKYRNEKGLTQEQLADKLNLSIHSVRKWEQGERRPRPGTIKRIAQILEVSTIDITGESVDDISSSKRISELLSKLFIEELEKEFDEEQDEITEEFDKKNEKKFGNSLPLEYYISNALADYITFKIGDLYTPKDDELDYIIDQSIHMINSEIRTMLIKNKIEFEDKK